MVAVNCLFLSEKAVLWTDSGQYDEDDNLIGIAPNCNDIVEHNMTIVVRYASDLLTKWPRLVAREGVDAANLIAADDDRLNLGTGEDSLNSQPNIDSVFWIVGWAREDDRPTITEFVAKKPPGERIKRFKSIMTPNIPSHERAALERVISEAESPDQIDTATFGTTMLEAQRRTAMGSRRDGTKRYLIGGYVMQTQITRYGIDHEILHTWPDRIGERIDPFAPIWD